MEHAKVLRLIRPQYVADDIGQQILVGEQVRKVFCRVYSVGQSELFEAGRNGYKPQYKVTMFAPDYHGEPIAQLEGRRYGIYRTYYAKGETLELYLEEKAGVTYAQQH